MVDAFGQELTRVCCDLQATLKTVDQLIAAVDGENPLAANLHGLNLDLTGIFQHMSQLENRYRFASDLSELT